MSLYDYVCVSVVWKKFRSDDLLPLQLRETDNVAYERWLMSSLAGRIIVYADKGFKRNLIQPQDIAART